jgi:Tfp pilus assembly protein PilF
LKFGARQALSLDPSGQVEAHLRLAAIYDAAGAKDRAAGEYEKFLKLKPDYSDRKVLGKYIGRQKKEPENAAAWERAFLARRSRLKTNASD